MTITGGRVGDRRSRAAVLVPALLLAACMPDPGVDGEVVTAATLGTQDIRPVDAYLAQPRYADADKEHGERLALACRSCHSLGPEGRNMIGPNLHGIFGTAAGGRDDYDYSRALGAADFIWTPRALEAWLAAPASFLPGNRMSFTGLRDDGDRADLVAYLLTATSTE